MANLTIITTVYNSYSLMDRYFDCLFNQSKPDFCVIIVDDCSVDNSYERLKQFLNIHQDERFSLIKTPRNIGPGGARNCAIRHVETDYFFFLDSDDYIDNNTIDRIECCLTTKHDFYAFDTIMESRQKKRIIKMFNKRKGDISFNSVIKTAHTGICSKVYKTSIVKTNEILFPDTYNGEDMAFNFIYYSFANSFFYCKKSFYHYLYNHCSLSNADYNRKMNELINSISFIRGKCRNEHQLIEYALLREVIYCKSQFFYINKSKKEEIISFFKKSMEGKSFFKLLSFSSLFQKAVFVSLRIGAFTVWKDLMRKRLG